MTKAAIAGGALAIGLAVFALAVGLWALERDVPLDRAPAMYPPLGAR